MKEGIKTTEFWISIAPVLSTLINKNDNPDFNLYMLICGTLLGVAYIISRTFVKCHRSC